MALNTHVVAKTLTFLIVTLLLLAMIGCPGHPRRAIPVAGPISSDALNINHASARDLERLPRIGTKTAKRIIAFREKFGRFRRPEHLMLVEGISERKFKELRRYVRVK